jgi:hypothetical protein
VVSAKVQGSFTVDGLTCASVEDPGTADVLLKPLKQLGDVESATVCGLTLPVRGRRTQETGVNVGFVLSVKIECSGPTCAEISGTDDILANAAKDVLQYVTSPSYIDDVVDNIQEQGLSEVLPVENLSVDIPATEVEGLYIEIVKATSFPTASPTEFPTSASCLDIDRRFFVRIDKKRVKRSCAWVARKSTTFRCTLLRVTEYCPQACGVKCTRSPTVSPSFSPTIICIDSKQKFVIPGGDFKGCPWVARRKTSQRCMLPGVGNICPDTCNKCTSAQTLSPITSPVPAPVSSPTGTVCQDRKGKFGINNVRLNWCRYAGQKNTKTRCNLDSVSENCPATCGAC